jgi:hypothetical protein
MPSAVSFMLGRGWRSKVLRQLAGLLDRIDWLAET